MTLERCEHVLEFRRRTLANQVVVYGTQCLRCGAWQAVKKSALTDEEMAKATSYDDDIRQVYWEESCSERQKEFDQIKQRQQREWWSTYNAYLNSSAWKRRREAVFARAKSRCEAQLVCQGDHATEVHHVTYQHVGNEPLWELRAVCHRCHEEITNMDREPFPETHSSVESASAARDIRRMRRAR